MLGSIICGPWAAPRQVRMMSRLAGLTSMGVRLSPQVTVGHCCGETMVR